MIYFNIKVLMAIYMYVREGWLFMLKKNIRGRGELNLRR